VFLALLVAIPVVMVTSSCREEDCPTCPDSPDLLTELTTGWWHHTRDLDYSANDLVYEFYTHFSTDTDTMVLIVHEPSLETVDACYRLRYQFSAPDTIRVWTSSETSVHYTFKILYSDSGEAWMATRESWGRSLRSRSVPPDSLANLCQF
jgi:hypothetical protein